MLRELSIRNFALIDDLHISFTEGLTILSGETGAGKSIIVNAVNLLLGSRATGKFVRTGADAAELEALFEIAPGSKTAELLEAGSYGSDGELLIRRVITAGDRTRVYINGRLGTLQQLSGVTETLASISGQHAHQGLLKEEAHLLILDQFGGLMPLRETVARSYRELQPLLRRLQELRSAAQRQTEHQELLAFQCREIAAAMIIADEDAQLEQELRRIKNSEMLFATAHGAIESLYGAQGAAMEQLVEVKKRLEIAAGVDPPLGSLADRLAEVSFRLEDIVEDLRSYGADIEFDPQRCETIEARLDTLKKLKRKYGGSLAAVLAHGEAAERELDEIGNLSQKISTAEETLAQVHARLSRQATQLSQKRAAAAAALAHKVSAELTALAIPQARFHVALEAVPADPSADPHLKAGQAALTESGLDRAVFWISPNVGEGLKPMASIASGGELSRIVLALKAILATTESVETIVFDEVDAGIGGRVAEAVGRKLAGLARIHQVVCITHLPQIAKFGDHHFRIAKSVVQGRTKTTICPLDENERVDEIARMLGGVTITQATLDHARELLQEQGKI
jgi:DNA repair protein RecN (Recombination protein N)